MVFRNYSKAFTLVELLIVLSLVMVASSVIVLSTGSGDGVSLKSSQRIISSVAQGARGQAILKQAKSRLIIYADRSPRSEEEKYLRFVGIITQDENDPKKWVAATKGTRLPKGIYFNPKASELISGNSIPFKQMKLQYPRINSQKEGVGESYFYYEFNTNGTIAKKFENAWLIISAGILRPDDKGIMSVDFEDPTKEGLKSGLIFRKVGTTTLVSDAVQIDFMIKKALKSRSKNTTK